MGIRKGLSIFLLLLLLLVSNNNKAYAILDTEDYINVENIKDTNEYPSIDQIPKTIKYKKGDYEGDISLVNTKQVSGENSKTIHYGQEDGKINFWIYDFCIWNSNTQKMMFTNQKGWEGITNKVVNKDGYSINVSLKPNLLGTSYTKYAPLQDENGYTINRGADKYPDEDWIGSNSLLNGATYQTAIHYYEGYYEGSITTQDTRKYVGIYSGKLKDLQAITLDCRIEKVADPLATTFRSGEKVALIMKTTNFVENIKVNFPNTLKELDSSLDTEFKLIPKQEDEVRYEFFIPIEAINDIYNLKVVASKNTPFRQKTKYPYFTVDGCILDDLRTRIKD